MTLVIRTRRTPRTGQRYQPRFMAWVDGQPDVTFGQTETAAIGELMYALVTRGYVDASIIRTDAPKDQVSPRPMPVRHSILAAKGGAA